MLTQIHQLYILKSFRKLRTILINENSSICQRCGKTFADTSQLVAHHRIEITLDNLNNPAITLNPDNIEIVCKDCHNIIHNRFCKREHNIYLVYGSPLSGKTTLVKELMSKGDIVVDIDKLWEAIAFCPIYDKPNNLRFNIFAVRNLLVDNIKTRYGSWNNAYIIGGYPDSNEREKLCGELGATEIYVSSTKEECLKRLQQREDRPYIRHLWQGFIEDWWQRYTPRPLSTF